MAQRSRRRSRELGELNPEASAYNNLMEQFIGDYIGIVAVDQAYVVWTDARDASTCQAVSDYQSAVYAGLKGAIAPNPDVACSTSFGNTDSEYPSGGVPRSRPLPRAERAAYFLMRPRMSKPRSTAA